MRFKEFLTEKVKKQREPEWNEVYGEYSKLSSMKSSLTERDFHRQQLFVPKRVDPEMEKRAKNRQLMYELEKDLKEESIPILTSFKDAPPTGGNKPSYGFWTSSAIKKGKEYTSDWHNYVIDNLKNWQTDYGFLFDIKPGALIFDIAYAQQFYEWALDAGKIKLPKSDFHHEYTVDDMRRRFPWDELAKHFDGARHHGHYGSGDEFTYGWDVESTVWFNTKYLTYKGAVKLINSTKEQDDD